MDLKLLQTTLNFATAFGPKSFRICIKMSLGSCSNSPMSECATSSENLVAVVVAVVDDDDDDDADVDVSDLHNTISQAFLSSIDMLRTMN